MASASQITADKTPCSPVSAAEAATLMFEMIVTGNVAGVDPWDDRSAIIGAARTLCGADEAGLLAVDGHAPEAMDAVACLMATAIAGLEVPAPPGLAAIPIGDGEAIVTRLPAIGGGSALLWAWRARCGFPTRERQALTVVARLGELLAERGAAVREHALLLAEARHRSANDLQLTVGLLAAQARRVPDATTRALLNAAAERVRVLADARRTNAGELDASDLCAGLRTLCAALGGQVPDRAIAVCFTVDAEPVTVAPKIATALLIAVNELVTNAIKHGFAGGDRAGTVQVALRHVEQGLELSVEDDGAPFVVDPEQVRTGLGFALVTRLLAQVRGSLLTPDGPAKRFTIRVPSG